VIDPHALAETPWASFSDIKSFYAVPHFAEMKVRGHYDILDVHIVVESCGETPERRYSNHSLLGLSDPIPTFIRSESFRAGEWNASVSSMGQRE
jgi:hypothetical protein